jgi:hypothetical protein
MVGHRAMKRRTMRFGSVAALVSCLLASRAVRAEPTSAEKATAEALFQQGTELMSEKRFATACEKFEGSQQLDPALGTMLRLADCYDRMGKSASAWALFREAASMARTRGEAERERIAAERATDLEKRLPKIELRVDRKTAPPGLEIQINGMSVPRATWDAPMPVDPGSKRVSASAPDRMGWSTTVEVSTGSDVRSVDVPPLAPKPKSEAPEAAPASPGALRSVGYVAGSLGIASLAVGGLLSYKAYDTNQQSLSQCRFEDPNACTAEGKETRDRAQALASGATIAFVAGGAALAGGVVLLLSSRSSEPHRLQSELRASAAPAPGGASIRLEGTW